MRIRQSFITVLAAVLILSVCPFAFAVRADQLPEETTETPVFDETAPETEAAVETETSGITQKEAEGATEEDTSTTEEDADTTEEDADTTEENTGNTEEEPEMTESEEDIEPETETDFPLPAEAPEFHARIEFRMGYTVIGTFRDFTPDITQIQTLYSLDGENWQIGTEDWNLTNLDTDDEYLLKGLQNQPCLFNIHEPLKSYIAGKIDCFYLKLRITRQNGLSYNTQSTMIERSGLQQIPEGTKCSALFSSSIAARESDLTSPYRYRKYGKYQLTVSADATVEDIFALLPDTLPVEIQLDHGPDFIAIGVVDCPVIWKPLSLPSLSAGESITIPDAAEEIVVPNGTLVSTPLGNFQLEETLSLDNPPSTDEVRLVLNVIQEDENPTGVLRAGKNGLEIAFHHKATGATSIQAYVLAEGESTWTKLSGLSLMEELNQPSTANSAYGLVLRNDQEPYQSYLAAANADETPTPFFIGLIIEGGIYDGKEFILPWPDIYEELPALPKFHSPEGNEGNVGADNKDDSTASGQRPNLPQLPDDSTEKQSPVSPPTANNDHGEHPADTTQAANNNYGEHPADTTPTANNNQREPSSDLPPAANNNHREHPVDPSPKADTDFWEEPWIVAPAPDNSGQNHQISQTPIPETASGNPEDQNVFFADKSVFDHPSESPENQSLTGQRPYLPHTESDTANAPAPNDNDSLTFAPSVILVVADIKEKEHTLFLSDTRIASRMPLFLMTAVAIFGVCISVAVLKAKGYDLFHRVLKKIQIMFGK